MPRERHRECGVRRPLAHVLTLPETATAVGVGAQGQPSASAVSTLSTKASTSPGSNCVPAPPRSSAMAALRESAGRYGLSRVMACHASQMAITRAAKGIASPARPAG